MTRPNPIRNTYGALQDVLADPFSLNNLRLYKCSLRALFSALIVTSIRYFNRVYTRCALFSAQYTIGNTNKGVQFYESLQSHVLILIKHISTTDSNME